MMMTKGNEKKTKAVYKYHITKLGEGETIPAKNGVSRRAKQPELLFPKTRKVKKIKKPKPKKYKLSKLQGMFNTYIRLRDKKCLYCGTTENLHCSHVKSIGAYPHLRFDERNAITLCYKHHIHWWHKEIGDAWKWYEKNFPEDAWYLERAKNSTGKIDKDELYETLSNLLKRYNAE